MSPFRAARFREHHRVLCLAVGAAPLPVDLFRLTRELPFIHYKPLP